METAVQRLMKDRMRESALEVKLRIAPGVVGQKKVAFAPEQCADGAVADRGGKTTAPVGFHSTLVGGMELLVHHDDADVEMVVRDDMADFGRDRLNDGVEIELPGE